MFADVYEPAETAVSTKSIVTVSVEPATVEILFAVPAIVAVFPLDIV